MNTHVTIEIDGLEEARDAVSAAFAAFERVERLVSVFNSSTPLSELNERGVLVRCDEELAKLLALAKALYRATGGCFDVTAPYKAALLRSGKRRVAAISPETIEISEGGRKVAITVTAKVDLSGIAKGYAVDAAVSVLTRREVRRALVNAGGDVRTIGLVGEPWKIGIQNPVRKTSLISIVRLRNEAIATSTIESNIVSPCLSGGSDVISATVISTRAAVADALATAVVACGSERGLEIVRRFPKTEVLMVTKDFNLVKSPGFETYEHAA